MLKITFNNAILPAVQEQIEEDISDYLSQMKLNDKIDNEYTGNTVQIKPSCHGECETCKIVECC